MNQSMLQQIIDRLAATSWQRSVFMALAVAAAATASVTATLLGNSAVGAPSVIAIGFAVAAAMRPDSHTALVAEAIIVWQWLAGADDALTPWAILVAACLLVFHSTIALMAVTPIGTIVDTDTTRAWAVRIGAAGLSAGAMWVLVAVLDQRVAPGSVALTALALAVLAALVLAVRALSAPVATRAIDEASG